MMLIMYLLGILFYPVNVLPLTFALEVKSCSALCILEVQDILIIFQHFSSQEVLIRDRMIIKIFEKFQGLKLIMAGIHQNKTILL